LVEEKLRHAEARAAMPPSNFKRPISAVLFGKSIIPLILAVLPMTG
jgi:hypothetical protein